MAYDSRGLMTRSEDENGLVSTYRYNRQGLLSAMTRTPPPGGGEPRTATYDYDAAGNMIRTAAADGVIASMRYDARGRLLSIEDNLGQRVDLTYVAPTPAHRSYAGT